MTRIRALRNEPGDLALGRELVREYVTATAGEIGQDLEVILPLIPELNDFAAHYLTSGGAFLVAEEGDDAIASVGITVINATTCEMNRMWVRAPFRRRGLARTISEATLDTARDLGFTRMILDVVPSRTIAIALYRSLGFTETAPAHDYPFEMVFLARDLNVR